MGWGTVNFQVPSQPKIDIFVPLANGGIFQHSVQLARKLNNEGFRTTLHTATDPEMKPLDVSLCHCVEWHRNAKHFRRTRITFDFLVKTLPHILLLRHPVWFQGGFKSPLTYLGLTLHRIFRKPTIFSPHALFVRNGSRVGIFFLNRCIRLAQIVVVYNEVDWSQLLPQRNSVFQIPLFQVIPEISHHLRTLWHERLSASKIEVGLLGQIRSDKNPLMLVEACHQANVGLVVAGEDVEGIAKQIHELVNRLGSRTLIIEGYLTIQDFVAIASNLKVAALPYSKASQSGVAEVANALGIFVLASTAGDIGDQSDAVVESLNSEDWALAIRAMSLMSGKVPDKVSSEKDWGLLVNEIKRFSRESKV
jgi:hypothetical protein